MYIYYSLYFNNLNWLKNTCTHAKHNAFSFTAKADFAWPSYLSFLLIL